MNCIDAWQTILIAISTLSALIDQFEAQRDRRRGEDRRHLERAPSRRQGAVVLSNDWRCDCGRRPQLKRMELRMTTSVISAVPLQRYLKSRRFWNVIVLSECLSSKTAR